MGFDLAAGLDGRGVLVTGAGGGIGREVARAFASAGARVLAVDLRREAVEAVVAELDGDGHVAAAVDLADIGTHGALVERARRELGELYVLAHLAAVLRRRSSIDDVTEEDWDIQLDVNLKAAFFLGRACARAMVEQGYGGRVIAFTSQGWQSGGFGGAVDYAASKGGIVSMTLPAARDLASRGVRVMTVAPGLFDTPLLAALPEEARTALGAGIPFPSRLGRPEEYARIVLEIVANQMLNGETIRLDGALRMPPR
jgi:NAD(P)-dependent dehydrogenase (short-subunit alcohol dehydrogenase family)